MTYDTDKFDLGYIEHIYNKIFDSNRIQKTQTILEIGIKNGGSIKYWRKLFSEAKIYCIDINCCEDIKNLSNIKVIIGDAYSNKCLDNLPDNSIDIIIDDGPHTLESFLFLLEHYLYKVKDGGLLIIEDIINLSWTPILVEKIKNHNIKCNYSVIDMRLKQKTPELYEKWKNGLDVLIIEKLNA
jgi:23S rRNA U2552 (ribose-2'-O)-methylase RlmE/FtsJ